MNKQTTTKKEVSIDKLNVKSIEERLSKVDVTKKEKKNKERIYKGIDKDMSYENQKKYRGKMRRKIKSYRNDIIIFAKTKKAKELKEVVKSFKSFYKDNYVTNDMSIQSIYQGRNEEDKKDFELMLDIVKS